jgi:hypothetical protein
MKQRHASITETLAIAPGARHVDTSAIAALPQNDDSRAGTRLGKGIAWAVAGADVLVWAVGVIVTRAFYPPTFGTRGGLAELRAILTEAGELVTVLACPGWIAHLVACTGGVALAEVQDERNIKRIGAGTERQVEP